MKLKNEIITMFNPLHFWMYYNTSKSCKMEQVLCETTSTGLHLITSIIIKYNTLGFHMVTSQPGSVCENRYQRSHIRRILKI